jgi:hypothetical protein
VPASQLAQASAFAMDEKEPAAQATHGKSDVKVEALRWPGLHVTAAHEVEPAAAAEVHAAQAVH